jgi:hypothetical protein
MSLPLSTLLFAACVAYSVEPALVINGDFSDQTAGERGPVHGWEGGDSALISMVSEGQEHFLRLTTTNLGVAMTKQRLAIQPEWKAVRVSARIRVQGLTKGADPWSYPCLQFLSRKDGSDDPLDGWSKFMVSESGGWRDYTQIKPIPAGAQWLDLEVWNMGCTAVTDFDRITVEPCAP